MCMSDHFNTALFFENDYDFEDQESLVWQKRLLQCIKWPDDEKVFNTVEGFQDLKNSPGVIRAIDSSHIHIKTPNSCPEENSMKQKPYPSVIL